MSDRYVIFDREAFHAMCRDISDHEDAWTTVHGFYIENEVKPRTVDVVFDGPPGPVCGRFVEVEDHESRASVGMGSWSDRGDGMWAWSIEVLP